MPYVAPTYSFATAPAAVSATRASHVPFKLHQRGRPAGGRMYPASCRSRSCSARVRAEQARPARATPHFACTVPPEPRTPACAQRLQVAPCNERRPPISPASLDPRVDAVRGASQPIQSVAEIPVHQESEEREADEEGEDPQEERESPERRRSLPTVRTAR